MAVHCLWKITFKLKEEESKQSEQYFSRFLKEDQTKVSYDTNAFKIAQVLKNNEKTVLKATIFKHSLRNEPFVTDLLNGIYKSSEEKPSSSMEEKMGGKEN